MIASTTISQKSDVGPVHRGGVDYRDSDPHLDLRYAARLARARVNLKLRARTMRVSAMLIRMINVSEHRDAGSQDIACAARLEVSHWMHLHPSLGGVFPSA